MEITVLGAHHLETASSRLACILVDGVLALDAGSLSSGLSLEQQKKVRAILLTHHHFDHVKDLPLIGLATGQESTKEVCAPGRTLDFVRAHLLDGEIYPKMEAWPLPEKPAFRLRALEALKQVEIAGYQVKPLQVKHGSLYAVGYEVRSGDGGTLFYTGDTGGDLSSCWQHTSPALLALEVSLPDNLMDAARRSGHMTPSLLEQELVEFKRLKGYLPRVLALHMNPALERLIVAELSRLAARLGAEIIPGKRYLKLSV